MSSDKITALFLQEVHLQIEQEIDKLKSSFRPVEVTTVIGNKCKEWPELQGLMDINSRLYDATVSLGAEPI